MDVKGKNCLKSSHHLIFVNRIRHFSHSIWYGFSQRKGVTSLVWKNEIVDLHFFNFYFLPFTLKRSVQYEKQNIL